MARRKRKSSSLAKARQRLAGLKSIDPALDMEYGFTIGNFENKISLLEQELDEYNKLLSELDGKLNTLQKVEKDMNDWNHRYLLRVGSKYGFDSNEYEQAGGTKQEERNKRMVSAKRKQKQLRKQNTIAIMK